MAHTRVTGIIRKRGQLTIPKQIRRAVSWLNPPAAVTIILERPDVVSLQPARHSAEDVDWRVVWKNIRRARRIKGKHVDTTAFIAADRQRRR